MYSQEGSANCFCKVPTDSKYFKLLKAMWLPAYILLAICVALLLFLFYGLKNCKNLSLFPGHTKTGHGPDVAHTINLPTSGIK